MGLLERVLSNCAGSHGQAHPQGGERNSPVAREVVDESGGPMADEEGRAGLEAPALWDLLGGLEGLQVLEKNSEVLVEIAFSVQRRYPEAIVISEWLRQDARELHGHVSRLKGAATMAICGFPFSFMLGVRRLAITR